MCKPKRNRREPGENVNHFKRIQQGKGVRVKQETALLTILLINLLLNFNRQLTNDTKIYIVSFCIPVTGLRNRIASD